MKETEKKKLIKLNDLKALGQVKAKDLKKYC